LFAEKKLFIQITASDYCYTLQLITFNNNYTYLEINLLKYSKALACMRLKIKIALPIKNAKVLIENRD